MNNPFNYIPDSACREAFNDLTDRLEDLRHSSNPADTEFIRELDEGKMLGVLIALDDSGDTHTLYAFSGQLGDSEFHRPGFVGPVFDYLKPDGYFKTKEAGISGQNREISLFKECVYDKARKEYEIALSDIESRIAAYKEKVRISKAERDARRKSGLADDAELAAMIRQSQFEKAELRRLKQKLTSDIGPLEAEMRRVTSHLDALRMKRRSDSEALQQWLFSNFRLLNAKGESRSLSEIFAATPMKTPPSGAGECCAPKLLQAAYLQGLHPVSIAEYWYGKPKGGELRMHGCHYPACRGKCLPVLEWMLQGLPVEPPLGENGRKVFHQPKVIFENNWFCVVDKPGGMLSVPGKGSEISVEQWLKDKYGSGREIKMAHRLDQDTSGLIIAAFGSTSFKVLQSLFATRKVRKTYVADLTGDYKAIDIPQKGRIELPLSPDWLDRPRQRVDSESGKSAVTDYEFTGTSDGCSRVVFHPLTGRTHQLRVHAASEMGLGMPIAGDRLYGIPTADSTARLHLHAQKIEFTFPTDGQHYSFEAPVPF